MAAHDIIALMGGWALPLGPWYPSVSESKHHHQSHPLHDVQPPGGMYSGPCNSAVSQAHLHSYFVGQEPLKSRSIRGEFRFPFRPQYK
ncbi:hypothetical protein PISMIDRAFT_688056 [Pisolithus microcarpus 441]|uniref:Uncharacterized protein n=1 Tax=Pisolithus microcarpus 441 TaxID=765257 RepID=A0A0C9Z2M2_9AGAM|nr:hypothetical protein PISMIDRAFT_688056 [Pisolithus microcarpus 441]